MRKRLIIYSLVLISLVGAAGYWLSHQPLPTLPAVTRPVIESKSPQPTSSFNKAQFSLSDPNSIWVVTNKKRALGPKDYAPADLVTPKVSVRVEGGATMQVRQVMLPALEKLFADAASHGTPLKLSSGYRSFGYQVNLYNRYVQQQGQAKADAQSARPGHSEHQTGLAVDVAGLSGGCNIEQCFGNTAAGKWVAAEAYKYGFILRYPDGLRHVTGYEYEPWHLRYIGVELATELHNKNVPTLEEYFGLGPADDY